MRFSDIEKNKFNMGMWFALPQIKIKTLGGFVAY